MRNVLFLVVFWILVLPNAGIAATRLYHSDFNSQTFPNTMFSGKTAVYWYDGSSHDAGGPGTWYKYVSPGRDGTGYAMKMANTPYWPYIGWQVNYTFPTNELYMSFWLRYDNWIGISQDGINLKTWYINLASGDGGNWAYWFGQLNSTPPYALPSDTDSFHAAKDASGKYMWLESYPTTPNATDGKWHKYELYINFATGTFRFWYDSVLLWNATYSNAGISNRYVQSIYFGSVKGRSFTPDVSGQRVFDDLEVWDGLPEGAGGGIAKENFISPKPPSNLIIQ